MAKWGADEPVPIYQNYRPPGRFHWVLPAIAAVGLLGVSISALFLLLATFGALGVEDTPPDSGGFATPIVVDVNVNAVLSIPTAAPTPTPAHTPAPISAAPTSVMDFCGAVPPVDKVKCRMPLPPAPTSTPLPACGSAEVSPGEWCQYRFTPTPAPTSTPTPIPATPTVEPIPTNQQPPTMEVSS